MAAPDRRAERRIIAGGVLGMVLLSANFAASHHALAAGLSVADLVLLRCAVVGPVFGVVLWRIGLAGLAPWRAVVIALLAGAPYFLLTAASQAFAPATHAAILNPGFTMLFAPLLAWWVLGTLPETGVRIGLVVLTLGLGLIGGGALLAGGGPAGRDQAWIGDLMLVGSGFIWALYGVLMRHWRIAGTRAAAIAGAFTLPWVPLHLALFGTGAIAAQPREALLQAGYQGLVAGGIAVVLYSRAVALLGPARGALLPPLVPAMGVFWAWLLVGERVTPAQLIGMVLVIAGMLCGVLWPRRR